MKLKADKYAKVLTEAQVSGLSDLELLVLWQQVHGQMLNRTMRRVEIDALLRQEAKLQNRPRRKGKKARK